MDERKRMLRRQIAAQPLVRATVSEDPFVQFQTWYEQAVMADLFQPHGMTLATADPSGRPSARMVLLEAYDEEGFVFFSSYDSRKALELTSNPYAALVVWWSVLFRQVRIEGDVARLSAAENDTYFATRPRRHQLEAWASKQSQIIAERQLLERRFTELEAQFEGREIPRPPEFGGYRLIPNQVDFWQARPDWLHDWLRYRRGENDGWTIHRLSP